MSYLGWDQQGDEFYLWILPSTCDLTHAVSAVAYYRVTGQTRSIVPSIVTDWPFPNNSSPRLHVTVGQDALPNGTEVEFWLEVTMDDASVVRVPGSGVLSIRVYR